MSDTVQDNIVPEYVEAMRFRDAALTESGVGRLTISVTGRGDVRDFLAAMVRLVRAEERARCVAVVKAEEEAGGPMPDNLWGRFLIATAHAGNRRQAEEIVRGTIAATKKSILAALTGADR